MKRRYFLALILTFIPFFTFAEDAMTEDEANMLVFDMGQIEIVGKAVKTETNAVSEVAAEQFDQKLEESVVDVVAASPGVRMTVGDKNEPQFFIRGLAQERTLVLFDGVPMAAPYYGDLDASELSLDSLSEIRIIRGNASVLYGPNALAGAVSLNSAKPSTNPNLRALLTADQEMNVFGRIMHGRAFEKWYYQVSAGFRESDGWRLSSDFEPVQDEDGNDLEDGDIREHAAFSQWSAGAKAGITFEKAEFALSAHLIDSTKEIPPTTDPNARINYWDFPTWKKYSIIAAGKFQITDNLDLRTNFFHHKYDNVLKSYRDPGYSEIRYESAYDDYSNGLNARLGWRLSDRFEARAAINGLIDNHKSQGNPGDPWEEYRAMTESIAAECEWLVTDSFTLQPGAAFEIYDFKTIDNVNVSDSDVDERTNDVNAPAFNILGTFMFQDRHAITMAVGMKNRFPNMNQLFANIDEVDPATIVPLDPEKAIQYSLGYEYRVSQTRKAGITGYYYDIDDLIGRPDRDALYINIDTARFSGIETWYQWTFENGLQTQLTYTYQKAEGEQDGGDMQDLPWVPDSIVRADVGYRFSCGTVIGAGYEYNSDAVEYDPDEMNIPSFSLWNAYARHDFKNGLNLTLDIDNLMDENYYRETGFEQPGRTIKLGLGYVL